MAVLATSNSAIQGQLTTSSTSIQTSRLTHTEPMMVQGSVVAGGPDGE